MAALSADRAALFGALAVQFEFVSSDALAAAMAAWRSDKTRSLGDILKCQGHLSAERHDALMALLDDMVREHGDARSSLAAMSAVPATLPQPGIGQAAVATLPQPAARPAEPDATPPPRAEASLDPDVLKTRPQVFDAAPSSQAASGSRYRVLKAHKKGGLGEVFVAEDTELGRRVALKEIQTRFVNDTASRTRFVLEAEVTGGLEHPGIVPVYGLGHYADGRPYYAMRFVQGDNLREALRRFHTESPGFDSLAFRQLLRRFVDVCNAVAYAHSRGVLHRDLKPGNVMLGQYGETLLVDWGLAKATGKASGERQRPASPTDDTPLLPRSGGESGMTVQGQAMGTPAYMSPEQARGDFDTLGAAADIYSLGASLYELLTGQVPFPDGDMEAVEAGRFPPPRSVKPSVPRALEAVCLKAMALKPADRYGSALDVAKEIDQWLADEPVRAYREPLRVRARRWIRKHARLVTGFAVALVATTAAMGLIAVEREQARKSIEVQRDIAQEQKRRSRLALDTMTSQVTTEWLGSAKPLEPQQRAFLEQALTFYDDFASEAAEDEDGRRFAAEVYTHRARMLYMLGDRKAAEAAYDRALLACRALAADYPSQPDHRRRLAAMYLDAGPFLNSGGSVGGQEDAIRRALDLRQQLAAEDPAPGPTRELAESYVRLGRFLRARGRFADAQAAHQHAVDILTALGQAGRANADVSAALAGAQLYLGQLLHKLGRHRAAETALRSGRAALPSKADSLTAHRLEVGLGDVLTDLGRLAEADAAYRPSARLAAVSKSTDLRRCGAMAVTGQARVLFKLGRVAQAQGRTSIARSGPMDDPFAADPLPPWVIMDPDEYDERPRNATVTAATNHSYGGTQNAVVLYKMAALLRQAAVDFFPDVPELRVNLVEGLNNRGTSEVLGGQLAAAEKTFREALRLADLLPAETRALPHSRYETVNSHLRLSILLGSVGRFAEAQVEGQAAVRLSEQLTADYPDLPDYRSQLISARDVHAAHLAMLARLADADKEGRRAHDEAAALAAAFPSVPFYKQQIAEGHFRAALRNLTRDPESALVEFNQAVAIHAEMPSEYRGCWAVRQFFAVPLFLARSQVLLQLNRAADSLADIDRAIEIDQGGANRLALKVQRADRLARCGRAVEALTEVDEVVSRKDAGSEALYNCSCVLGVLAAKSAGDKADAYSTRAVPVLRQAIANGFHNIPHLLADPDLAPLRGRAGYADFLWDLADTSAPPK